MIDRSRKEKKLSEVLRFLQKEHGIDPSEILHLVQEKERRRRESESYSIPVSLFGETPLSALEVITRFLRDVKKLRFTEMSAVLGRDQRVLSTTYRNAKEKFPSELKISSSKYYVPCHLLQNKQFSVLEHIVLYIKESCLLSNGEIATLLNKDPRTIWTILHRIKKKGKGVR